MRKKARVLGIIIVLMLILILSGCSSGKVVSGNEYNFEFDDQYYLNKMNSGIPIMAESKEGYYFFSGSMQLYLYYMEKTKMKTAIMCNKPDCLHADETDPKKLTNCNAFFPNTNCNMVYYDSSLYVLGRNDDLSFSLYQVSLDATKRKKLYTFKDYVYNMIIHRGYIYYIVNDNVDLSSTSSKSKLYRLKLDDMGKTPELIYEFEGTKVSFINLVGYRDFIYFQQSFYEDEKLTTRNISFLKYDPLSNKCEKFIDAARINFYGETVLYSDPHQQVFTCKLDGTGSTKLEGISGHPFGADEKYIYIRTTSDGQDKLSVYDWQGKAIASFDLPKRNYLFGGDDRYFFVYELGGLGEHGSIFRLYAINKTKLANGTATMEKLNEFIPTVEYPGVITQN